MELRQLRYFVKVVEHGSFSQAAAALGVPSPACPHDTSHTMVNNKNNSRNFTGTMALLIFPLAIFLVGLAEKYRAVCAGIQAFLTQKFYIACTVALLDV